jgi:hypothetical protein
MHFLTDNFLKINFCFMGKKTGKRPRKVASKAPLKKKISSPKHPDPAFAPMGRGLHCQ